MFAGIKWRLVQVLLILAVVLPASAAAAASNVTTAQAGGVCYWTSNLWDTVYGYPSATATYASSIRYRIGLDCAFNRVALNVNYFSDTLTVTNAYSYAYHASNGAAVCGYSDYYHNCWAEQWATYNWSGGCYGSCTSWRGGYLNLWFGYNSTAALWEHWVGCDYAGYGFCDTTHYFVQRYAYVYYGG